MIVKRDVDENGVSITTIFGFAIRDIVNGFGIATIAGAIWWTANLSYRVDNIAKSLIDPSSYARLESKVDAIRARQDEVLAGSTIPQNLMREKVQRLESEMAGMNVRCSSAHTEINNLERIVDRLVLRVEALQKIHDKEPNGQQRDK